MFVFVYFLLALCHHAISTNPSENKSEKNLFVPTFNHATLVHLNPLGYGSHSLENIALYPQYVYDHGSHDYLDPLQRQLPYQDNEKRLITFLNAGKAPKPHKANDLNEDDYKRKANNILYLDELKPELDDLDLKFKRSLTYASYTPPNLSSNNRLEDRIAPSNSRAVPFGPYTTWLPYEPMITSYASQNVQPTRGSSLKKNRRRRDVVHDEESNHLTLPQQPIIPRDYVIPVPIAYSTPIIRNVPLSPDAMLPINTLFTGKLSTSLDTVPVPQNSDLTVSYNVIPTN